MSTLDRGYTNLLAHLQHSAPSLPLETIQAALSHYLANLSPLPTPLAASAVTSPFFLSHTLTHQRLQSLFTAFRHAAHLKYRNLKDSSSHTSTVGALFSRSIKTRLRLWAGAVLKGVQGGQPLLRLASCGGLLVGLEDLSAAEGLQVGEKGPLENEIIVALAESMDAYAHLYGDVLDPSTSVSEWEKEFQAAGEVDAMSMALILASQSFPLVAPQKLNALPLRILTRLLVSAISSAFQSGGFLVQLSSSVTSTRSHKITISPTSVLSQNLISVEGSPLISSIASISKLTASTLTAFLELHSAEGMMASLDTLEILQGMARRVEDDWNSSALAQPIHEDEIAPDTRDLTKLMWKTLKTLLFSTIMIADAALSAAVFVSPSMYNSSTPSTLALMTLHTLSHLSFVISQFGGVTTTSTEEFPELKKTFYLALDILAQSQEESERFVRELCLSFHNLTRNQDPNVQAKKAYALASIEQLIPVLSGECIQSYAFPLCLRHLSDSAYRETYESAHSVVLAIFASYAHQQAIGDVNAEAEGADFTFAKRLIPFYAHCLIENSADGKLNEPQLRLAFSALVKSASAGPTGKTDSADENYTLAWYCIESILDAIHSESPASDSSSERLHRLHLTLIAAIPSLPLKLLPRVLEEIRNIITMRCNPDSELKSSAGMSWRDKRKDLVDALLDEILGKVGDREKEYVMRWWYGHRREFLLPDGESEMGTAVTDGDKPIDNRPDDRRVHSRL